MAGSISKRGSELLNQIEAIIDEELGRGIERLGRRVTTRIALEFGGSSVYFPFDKARRDARLYEEYTGNNISELRARYKLNESTVYQIMRQERVWRRQKQTLLPGVSIEE